VAKRCSRQGSRRVEAGLSARARVGYELLLPALLAGELPATGQAQAAKALINTLTPEECDEVTTIAEVEDLTRDR
jgi:hypothetical protein